MPLLTVIEPVVEPTVPPKPQRALIVLASLLLGLFVGCGFVLIQPIFSQIVSSKKQAHTIPIKRMKKISSTVGLVFFFLFRFLCRQHYGPKEREKNTDF